MLEYILPVCDKCLCNIFVKIRSGIALKSSLFFKSLLPLAVILISDNDPDFI